MVDPRSRSRATTACDSCSNRRAKCDGLTPRCSRCEKRDLECTYTRTLKKRGPPKGTISMKERLARLEQMLQDGSADGSSPGTSGPAAYASLAPGTQNRNNKRSASMSVSEASEAESNSNNGAWQHGYGHGNTNMSMGPPTMMPAHHHSMPPPFVPSYSGSAVSPAGISMPSPGGSIEDLRMIASSPASAMNGYASGQMPYGTMSPMAAPYGYHTGAVNVLPPILSPMSGYVPGPPSSAYTPASSNQFGTPPPMMPAPMPPVLLPPIVSIPVQLPVQTAAPEPTPAAIVETIEGPSYVFNSPVFGDPYLVDAQTYRKLIKNYAKIMWPSLPILHTPTLLKRPSVYPDFLLFVVLASAIRFSKDTDVTGLIRAATNPPCYSAGDLAKAIIDHIIPVIESRLYGYSKPPGTLEMIAMLHGEMMFGAISGRVVAGLRLLDTLLIMSREIPQPELLKTERTGDDWIRWEENRRLMWRLFLVDRLATTLSSIRYFTIPMERIEKIPLPCSDELFNLDNPVPASGIVTGPLTNTTSTGSNAGTPGGPGGSSSGSATTLAMFAGGLQAYPLFLPQLSSLAKNCVLLFILTQIIDYQRVPIQHRTPSQKQYLEAQLTAWYDCMPVHEQTDYLLTRAGSPNSKSPEVDPDAAPRVFPEHVMLFYHHLEVTLHSPPRGEAMLEDEEWLASDDFLRAAEHASLIISLLKIVDTAVMPLWIMEAVMLSTQMHILLARKLIGYQSDELHAELLQKIDTAIETFESIGNRRPSAVVFAIILKLVMTRIVRIGRDYFADDPPPDDLDFELFSDAIRASLGFETTENMVMLLESIFGKQGRIINTIRFFRNLITML